MATNLGLFVEISLLVVLAAFISFLMRILKQPLIIGHIITGLIVGPIFFNLIRSTETLQLFSEIGIAFLLFIVGLNLSPHIIKEFGKIALITGIGQMVFTTLVGYFICLVLGLSQITSIYLAIALSFSSTIIILKLISDKKDLEKLYSKISIGFLLVQDIIAILLLFIIPLISLTKNSLPEIGFLFLKGVGFLFLVFFAAFYFLPKINRFLSKSQELLFIFSAAWGMGLAALFKNLGFSLESGALIAGVSLAILPSKHEISARFTPLRDFFIILFFILLGSQMSISSISSIMPLAIIFSIFVLIGNPLILMVIMGLLGYRKKTSFQTGLTVAQISEFSLILIALGVSLNHLEPKILSLTTLVGLITIFGSTYFILYSDKIYNIIGWYLNIFERKIIFEKEGKKKKFELVLFGYNRIGYNFLEVFKKMGKDTLVIDYDPIIIEDLAKKNIDNIFGDAEDAYFIESLNFKYAKIVVSTIPVFEPNLLILEKVKKDNPEAIVMVVSHSIKEALELYQKGANYVILPHLLGGEYASLIIEKFGASHEKFEKFKNEHIKHLRLRASIGHEHPLADKSYAKNL